MKNGRWEESSEYPLVSKEKSSTGASAGSVMGLLEDRRQEEKGTTEDEVVGWHHQLNGREFEQAPGVGDGQGSLACCSLLGRKESDATVTELN